MPHAYVSMRGTRSSRQVSRDASTPARIGAYYPYASLNIQTLSGHHAAFEVSSSSPYQKPDGRTVVRVELTRYEPSTDRKVVFAEEIEVRS